jgi:hypothetical protein
LIIYRKSGPLRIRRATAPEPPWWYATAIAPYSAKRSSPVAIDYLDLTATAADKLEVSVADNVKEDLTAARVASPVLIDGAEFAESVFRRGEEAIEVAPSSLFLISTRGELPEEIDEATLVVATWPLEIERLEKLFESARRRALRFGVVVPVIFPVTTNLEALEQLVKAARGAEFIAAIPVDLDPTAKQAIARSLTMPGDDETYQMLFHSDLEPLHVATERHIAALAHELGVHDFVVPPEFDQKTNWNAATLLMLAATRMIAMEHEVELAGTLARAARVVAQLDKPLTRIAEAANLAIVEALDEVSVDVLSDWLERGHSSFVDRINERWRVRRDAGVYDAPPSPSS